jgi:hypothetical protein
MKLLMPGVWWLAQLSLLPRKGYANSSNHNQIDLTWSIRRLRDCTLWYLRAGTPGRSCWKHGTLSGF